MWYTSFIFCRKWNWSNGRSQFWYLQKTFSMLSSKCIFKAPLNGLYVLKPMIHDTCIFIEISTGAIGDHVTLVKLLIFSKGIFKAIIQLYFQSSSEWFIGFTAYDTPYLHFFFRKLNWSYSRSSFEQVAWGYAIFVPGIVQTLF